jgi:hypothetical protein
MSPHDGEVFYRWQKELFEIEPPLLFSLRSVPTAKWRRSTETDRVLGEEGEDPWLPMFGPLFIR